MSNKNRLDSTAIAQAEHNPDLGAKKVELVNAEMELSADDGDSVQTQGRVFEYSPSSKEEIDITACRQIKVYSSGAITIEISPDVSGDNWIVADTDTDDSEIINVLARRARITSSGTIKVLGRG